MSSESNRPCFRIFLDVDDTLNVPEPLPEVAHELDRSQELSIHYHTTSVGLKLWYEELITWRSAVVEELVRLESAGCELVWLTGWQKLAQELLSPLFGFKRSRWLAWESVEPEELELGKLAALAKLQREEPLPFAWCDDIVTHTAEARSFGEANGGFVLALEPGIGLTPEHLATIGVAFKRADEEAKGHG